MKLAELIREDSIVLDFEAADKWKAKHLEKCPKAKYIVVSNVSGFGFRLKVLCQTCGAKEDVSDADREFLGGRRPSLGQHRAHDNCKKGLPLHSPYCPKYAWTLPTVTAGGPTPSSGSSPTAASEEVSRSRMTAHTSSSSATSPVSSTSGACPWPAAGPAS